MDEKLGRTVTRVVLPRVVMHSRHHYAVFNLFLIFSKSSVSSSMFDVYIYAPNQH